MTRGHPIAQGLGECLEIDQTEMYGEPFAVPEPMETLFVSWYEGGEVFRSGMTWRRGAGKIFSVRPVTRPIRSITMPASSRCCATLSTGRTTRPRPGKRSTTGPNVPVGQAKEKIVQKGARLHADGDKGLS